MLPEFGRSNIPPSRQLNPVRAGTTDSGLTLPEFGTHE
jgi:hypothetical protein